MSNISKQMPFVYGMSMLAATNSEHFYTENKEPKTVEAIIAERRANNSKQIYQAKAISKHAGKKKLSKKQRKLINKR